MNSENLAKKAAMHIIKMISSWNDRCLCPSRFYFLSLHTFNQLYVQFTIQLVFPVLLPLLPADAELSACRA